MTALARAWIWLALFSATTTMVALSPLPAPYSGALILVFAWAKARLIFLHYLELAHVPGWRGGIMLGLAIFMCALFAPYLALSTM